MASKRQKAKVNESEESNSERTPKSIWHPLHLQRVPLGRFVDIVNQILQGRLTVYDSSLRGASSTRDEDGSSDVDSGPPSSRRR